MPRSLFANSKRAGVTGLFSLLGCARLRIAYAAALLVLVATPAHAGRIYVFAEAFYLTTTSTCTKTVNSTTQNSTTTINCPSNVLTTGFRANVAFPPDAPNSWSYRVWYTTPDTASNKSCSWQIQARSRPHDSRNDLGGGEDTATVIGGPIQHANNRQYKTDISTATAVYNTATSANCSSTACQDTEVRLNIALIPVLFSADSASECDFRYLEIEY